MQITEQGNRLSKSVDIRPFNRPVKVAFLVPVEENQISHWILDGIFYEAYSRWGGAHSLIIPFQDGHPVHNDYMPWLSFLDPDFVYSYVELDDQIIREINQIAMPIEMTKHKVVGEPETWRDYIPEWPHGFDPVRSISTLTSPLANYSGWSRRQSSQIYITQRYENDTHRFLSNNFGIAHDTSVVTYGQPGLFETMCYCPEDVPENNNVGNYRSANLTEFLEKLASRQLKTFSRLATIHATGISHPSDYQWKNSFHLFVGETVSDRLHFWNSRHLSESSSTYDISSLIVSPALIDDDDFCYQLGQFLNHHNFKGMGNGSAHTNIRSLTIDKDQCQTIAAKLQPLTWTLVRVTDDYARDAVPDPERYRDDYSRMGATCPPLKVNESPHTYIAHEPEHFQYLTPNFLHVKRGQWLVELQIERYQNDCQIKNIYND